MSINLPAIKNNVKHNNNINKVKKNKLIGPLPPLEKNKKDASSMWKRLEHKPVILPKLLVAEKAPSIDLYSTDGGNIHQTSAELAKKLDFFSKFLTDKSLDAKKVSEYLKFQNFCQVHGDSEKKQRLFYSLKARKSIIQREIEVVKQELQGYDSAEKLFNVFFANKDKDIHELCDETIEKYSNLSYELVSLKAKEEHWKTKLKLQKAVANRYIDHDQITMLHKELDIELLLIVRLDKDIATLVTQSYDMLSSDPVEVSTPEADDLRPQSKQYMEALNQLIHLKGGKKQKRAK
ncbi:unnamed protein product [Bursaphelenchus okinawaensis]|uniref:Uncharacterized protein n=1 Tax=Bursaphelenchus okinawaensis TaxID=465554 RepID=A0A811KX05_9BILA|nr:unnamed protein product [Bursaphelenchus okinawaensis]CAG9113576.1 unnamed protein product [Bursaphelenchus okinawaensis]